MSFTRETKEILACGLPEKECCRDAMLYGMLLFTAQAEDKLISLTTEIRSIAEIFLALINSRFQINAEMKAGTSLYKVELSDKDSAFVCALFPPMSRRIRRELLSCGKCGEAFFRGVFLVSGFVNPPEKTARLELSTPDADLACDTAALLTAHFRLPKLSVRRGNQILYYRDAESVEYFLSYIGANKASFTIMNAQMLKEKRNEINRKANFEYANISKTVHTAGRYMDAIRALLQSGDFDKLSPELRRTAKLRLENDTMTLSELGALENPPISKSQVSKRLQKIMDFYEISQNKPHGKE